MSADNWRQCPRCERRDAEAFDARVKAAKDAYGTVPADEWLAMKHTLTPPPETRTLREDYEFWIDGDGIFHAVYGAGCEVCGFAHDFNHFEPVAL